MRKKVLFGIDYTNSEFIKVILYLFVGGTAALVEWGLFYIFITYVFGEILAYSVEASMYVMLATALAFSLATLYHYFLGNVLVFDSGSKYNRSKELSLVFLVSVIGLLLNLLLMYIFVTLFAWHMMFSKVLTSCLVVVWNYLSRKKWIFRS